MIRFGSATLPWVLYKDIWWINQFSNWCKNGPFWCQCFLWSDSDYSCLKKEQKSDPAPPRPLHTFLVIPTFSALLSPTKPFSNNKLKQHRSRGVSLDFPSSAKSRLTLVHLPRVKCFAAAEVETTSKWVVNDFNTLTSYLSWLIWVNLPRTGKMVKMWPFLIFFGALLWPNGLICLTFLNCSEEILSVRF